MALLGGQTGISVAVLPVWNEINQKHTMQCPLFEGVYINFFTKRKMLKNFTLFVCHHGEFSAETVLLAETHLLQECQYLGQTNPNFILEKNEQSPMFCILRSLQSIWNISIASLMLAELNYIQYKWTRSGGLQIANFSGKKKKMLKCGCHCKYFWLNSSRSLFICTCPVYF